MVWRKKKINKYLEKKREIFSYSNKKKYISNRYFLSWKHRFFWLKKDFFKYFDKFKKGKKQMFKFYSVYSNFFLINSEKKKYNDFFFLRVWFLSIMKILIRDGKKLYIYNILKYVIYNLKLCVKNLKLFFFKIKKNMHLPLRLRVRIVAGRKVNVPVILNQKKEIMLIIRFIFLSLKNRNEKKFKDRLLNELLDVFNNKGITIKRKAQYIKDLKDSVPNIKYLNF